MRSVGAAHAAAGTGKAGKMFEEADKILADGPDVVAKLGGMVEAVAIWDDAYGKHDDPETRARIAAAVAAMARLERDQADTAAQKGLEREAAAAAAQQRRRRRGRRD